jgi:hypothetical protein
MAAITSNGTGGGNYSAGASWNGGVAPALGDTAQVLNGDTITIDATFTVGDDTATPAMDVLNGGTLDWDNLGSDTCTFRGDFYVRNGGTLTLDGTGTRTNILTIELNDSAALAAGKYGLLTEDGAIVDVDGFDYTRSWDTLSADAAAGQLNVVTTNDNSAIWFVGDRFVVGGTTITKAGANYAWAHEQNVAICHHTRNIVFTSINVAFAGYIYPLNTTPGNVDFAWCQFFDLGSNAATKYGITFLSTTHSAIFTGCSFYDGFYHIRNGSVTLVDCVFYDSLVRGVANNIGTCVDCALLGSTGRNFDTSSTVISGTHIGNAGGGNTYGGVITVSDCRFYGNVNFGIWSGTAPVFTDCFFDGEGEQRIQTGTVRFDDCSFGVQVANTVDIDIRGVAVGTGVNTLVLNVDVADAAPTNLLSLEDTANNHKTWKAAGTYEKQNAVVRTGSFAMLMEPTSATDELIAPSTIPTQNGVQVAVTAFLRKNAAYGAATRPTLRLSGKGLSDSDTMTDVDNTWELLTVSGVPTSDGFATVEFVAQSAGVGAAAYVDDVKFVYTEISTGDMDYWFEGDIPPVLMNTGLGAVDVWDVLLTQISAVNSIGLLLETNVDQALSTTESNIRGADSDDLKDISDEIAAIPAAPTPAAIAAAVWAAIVEGGHTFADAIRIFLAVLAGRSIGGGTNTVSFRDVANAKDRVRVQVDSNGNRVLVITLDGT